MTIRLAVVVHPRLTGLEVDKGDTPQAERVAR
jgi:hypothetical protein